MRLAEIELRVAIALLGKEEFAEVERVRTVEGEEGVLLVTIGEELVRLEMKMV